MYTVRTSMYILHRYMYIITGKQTQYRHNVCMPFTAQIYMCSIQSTYIWIFTIIFNSTVIMYLHRYTCIQMYLYTCIHILDPPVIDEGSDVPRPCIITGGNKRVNIGTPVYVYSGFDVIIDCNIVNGTPPITIQWFRNGSPDTTRGNVSTITITDASDGDVFRCTANNTDGFDTKNNTIHVEHGKYLCNANS